MVNQNKFKPEPLIERLYSHLEQNLETLAIVEPKLRNNITLSEPPYGADDQFNIVILEAVMTVLGDSENSAFWFAQEAYGWDSFEDAADGVRFLGYSKRLITEPEALVADILQLGAKRIAVINEEGSWDETCFAVEAKK
ncbi:hypothetical protein ABFV67_11385 [Vibrio metschnikovii]|uniref:Uncharacterized protein n=1 Tax=bacterium 19PA01SH03 TaxID=2920705 RepID=A0AAU6SP00_UNCXX|nr:hypothetical protein [Vibrio metschnikovii]EKO3683605.1 hypothetical protein [Vibrio metschnikovii]EKO3739407.1 hypothetical protein [Vibrio metschnikovii]EKO3873012.1 hypothetical protein [Vibrio metschnikovii]EKO3882736.1 hypothetical protein [Vibrio metschnikovii]